MSKIKPDDIAYEMIILRELSKWHNYLKERKYSDKLVEKIEKLMEDVKHTAMEMSIEALHNEIEGE